MFFLGKKERGVFLLCFKIYRYFISERSFDEAVMKKGKPFESLRHRAKGRKVLGLSANS